MICYGRYIITKRTGSWNGFADLGPVAKVVYFARRDWVSGSCWLLLDCRVVFSGDGLLAGGLWASDDAAS